MQQAKSTFWAPPLDPPTKRACSLRTGRCIIGVIHFKTVKAAVPTLAALFLAGALLSQEKTDFANHPFFKHLIGRWTAEGTLKNVMGEESRLVEEWKATVSGEGALLIEGWRQINDDRHDFRWNITHNQATGLYEATHVVNGNEADAQRFEASVSDVALTMELKAPLGSSGSILLKDSFTDNTHDVMRTEVTLTGDAGEVTLSGEVKHRRQKDAPGDG